MTPTYIRFDQILGVDPKNRREKYTQIEELAQDIARRGLLQNIVVFEVEKDKYLVKAGSRRYLALKLLHDRGLWPDEKAVHVIVMTFIDSDSGAAENVQRVDLAPWEIAQLAADYEEQGLTQEQIGQRICKNQSTVSRYLLIHRNLHPRVRKAMVNLWPTCLTLTQIYEIACIVDIVTEEPNEEEQVAAMARFLGQPKHSARKPKARNERYAVLKRIQHLERAIVPLHAQPYVQTIVDYLGGKKKRLSFGRG